jgi:hypothetical protein
MVPRTGKSLDRPIDTAQYRLTYALQHLEAWMKTVWNSLAGFRITVVGVALLVFAACTVEPVKVKDARLVVPTGGDAGFLVGSIGRTAKGRNASYASRNELRIRNLDTGASLEISHAGGDVLSGFLSVSPTDIEEGVIKASLFRIALPPGRYEIYKAFFFFNSGTLLESYENTENFSYLFNIDAGKEIYLGEAIASAIKGKNVFGLPITVGYRFDFSDRSQRDFERLSARFADFSPANTSIFIPVKSIAIDRNDMTIVPFDASAAVGPAAVEGP